MGSRKASARLMAVSKGQSAAKMRCLYELGQRYFGENYLQELESKQTQLGELDIYWSFIGQLQSRKIPKIISLCKEIQSIASDKHLSILTRSLKDQGKQDFPIFLAVNADEEAQKKGFLKSEVVSVAENIEREFKDLIRLEGIMCIPSPKHLNELPAIPKLYLELRELANQVGHSKLSLGMSTDLEVALAAGSDIIRIGSALLGARQIKSS